MTPARIRKALGWFVIVGGALVVVTCQNPSIGLVGFVLAALGAALIVDD